MCSAWLRQVNLQEVELAWEGLRNWWSVHSSNGPSIRLHFAQLIRILIWAKCDVRYANKRHLQTFNEESHHFPPEQRWKWAGNTYMSYIAQRQPGFILNVHYAELRWLASEYLSCLSVPGRAKATLNVKWFLRNLEIQKGSTNLISIGYQKLYVQGKTVEAWS
jgi:hypothetical protein